MRALSLAVVAVGFGLGLIAPSCAATLKTGLIPFLRGDYAAAFSSWQPLAQAGNPAAETAIGLMLAMQVTPESLSQPDSAIAADSDRWLRKAGDNGEALLRLLSPFAEKERNEVAEAFVGIIYAHRADGARATFWTGKAAAQGNAVAEAMLGLTYQYGTKGLPLDYGLAAFWYRKSADQGYFGGQIGLAGLYGSGYGVPRDLPQAAALFRKAADQGIAQAQFALGTMYAGGWGLPQDYVQARVWLGKAADQGIADAKTALAALGDKPTSPNAKPVPSQTAVPAARVAELQPTQAPSSVTEVALADENGTFGVPVLVNDAIKLNFTLDSGSADVVIPADVFGTLKRAGTISSDDIGEVKTYTLANGTTVQSQTFRIRSLKVGNQVFENVAGSVGAGNGLLLLGQTFLRHFKSWSIDNNRQMLVLVPN